MKPKDDNWCFACGVENPIGLKLADIHLEAQDCVCTFKPEKHHQGWAEILHGGITSTLLDEIMTHVLWRRGFDAMTAEMSVRFKRPIEVAQRLQVRARIVRRRGKLAETEGEVLLEDGAVGATATGKYLVTERGPDEPGGRISLAARRAVIFDLFGTLAPVFEEKEYFDVLREMAGVIGMDGGEFVQAFRADAPLRTTGQWPSLKGNIADIVRRGGLRASEEAIQRATDIRYDYTRRQLMNPYPDALAALRALREAGRPLGLISDCSPETPPIWPETPLAEFIPEPVFSAAVGIRKPAPEIYRMACERMGVGPSRAVYVGDGDSRELPGAREVGLCPILIDRGETSAFRTEQDRDADIIVRELTEVLPLVGVEDVGRARARDSVGT